MEKKTVAELRKDAVNKDNVRVQVKAVTVLAFHNDVVTQGLLVKLLKKDPNGLVQLLAACALAYQGRRDGVLLLDAVASQRKGYTSSGFEVSFAGLALTLLGEPLPVEFSVRVNLLFPILNRCVRRIYKTKTHRAKPRR